MRFLKKYLLAGALVILPAWLAILLLLTLVEKLAAMLAPLSQHLPTGFGHPALLAAGVVALLCVVAGMITGTKPGQRVQQFIERKFLERFPGYSALRSLTAQLTGGGAGERFQPALVQLDDGFAPGFIVETHPDGLCTVFLPTAPTPAAGSILIVSATRVHPSDMPVMKLFQCVSQWGSGSSELLASVRSKPLPPPSAAAGSDIRS